jgi:hypothetical protein
MQTKSWVVPLHFAKNYNKTAGFFLSLNHGLLSSIRVYTVKTNPTGSANMIFLLEQNVFLEA